MSKFSKKKKTVTITSFSFQKWFPFSFSILSYALSFLLLSPSLEVTHFLKIYFNIFCVSIFNLCTTTFHQSHFLHLTWWWRWKWWEGMTMVWHSLWLYDFHFSLLHGNIYLMDFQNCIYLLIRSYNICGLFYFQYRGDS